MDVSLFISSPTSKKFVASTVPTVRGPMSVVRGFEGRSPWWVAVAVVAAAAMTSHSVEASHSLCRWLKNAWNMGVSKNGGYPKLDGLSWKTLSKLMIWEYHYFWKHPYVLPVFSSNLFHQKNSGKNVELRFGGGGGLTCYFVAPLTRNPIPCYGKWCLFNIAE